MDATRVDPVLVNARREALWIFAAWVGATAYCCVYSYLYGYIREGHDLTRDDVHPFLGMPSWFVWGVLAPWGVCLAFTFWFVLARMTEDDLGTDHAGAGDVA